jgi:hypothetical protein
MTRHVPDGGVPPFRCISESPCANMNTDRLMRMRMNTTCFRHTHPWHTGPWRIPGDPGPAIFRRRPEPAGPAPRLGRLGRAGPRERERGREGERERGREGERERERGREGGTASKRARERVGHSVILRGPPTPAPNGRRATSHDGSTHACTRARKR